MSRNYPISWRSSIVLLTAAAGSLLIAALPVCGAVPPASGTGFGNSSSSSGSGFSGGTRTPSATVPSGSFSVVPPALSSMPAPAVPPGTGNLSFPSGSNITQANGGAGASGPPRLSFPGQGSALGAFGSNFPGQAGVGGDFRGPAGAAGGVVSNASSPTTPQPNLQPNTQPTTTSVTTSGSPASSLIAGNNSNPLVVHSATSSGLSQTPTGATATTVAQTYDWRYVNYNGTLWYWSPNNTWLYYQNGAWQPFAQTPSSQTTAGPQSAGQTPYVAGAVTNSATGGPSVLR